MGLDLNHIKNCLASYILCKDVPLQRHVNKAHSPLTIFRNHVPWTKKAKCVLKRGPLYVGDCYVWQLHTARVSQSSLSQLLAFETSRSPLVSSTHRVPQHHSTRRASFVLLPPSSYTHCQTINSEIDARSPLLPLPSISSRPEMQSARSDPTPRPRSLHIHQDARGGSLFETRVPLEKKAMEEGGNR